ncbi:MAG: alpha/beta fold hydrolase [Chlamydiia bacterium]
MYLKKNQEIKHFQFLYNLHGMGDPVYQKRVWINCEGPECDSFEDSTGSFFENVDKVLNDTTISEKQYKLLNELKIELKSYCDIPGRQYFFFDEYIDTPEWEQLRKKICFVLQSFNYEVKKEVSLNEELVIELPKRIGIPTINLHCTCFLDSKILGERDVLLIIPGGPGYSQIAIDDPSFHAYGALGILGDILLFDPRGCGKSDPSALEYCTLEHYIDDIEAIRLYFEIPPDKLILVGQGYGSIAALGYATKHPKNLSKLILVNGAASSDFLLQAYANLSNLQNPKQKDLGRKLLDGNLGTNLSDQEFFFQTMISTFKLSDNPDFTASFHTSNFEIQNYGYKSFLKKFDFRPDLNKIECKTLIIWGEGDWLFDPKQGKILHNGIKNSTLKIFPECGHFVLIDQWHKFRRSVIDFLTTQENKDMFIF